MVEWHIEKMRCGGCANRVTQAVRAADNAATVDIDLARKTVRVDSILDIRTLADVLAKAGYPATQQARN